MPSPSGRCPPELSLAKMTPALLEKELGRADLHTLAEIHGLKSAVVRKAEKLLRFEGAALDGLAIFYRRAQASSDPAFTMTPA